MHRAVDKANADLAKKVAAQSGSQSPTNAISELVAEISKEKAEKAKVHVDVAPLLEVHLLSWSLL